jgi:hypothetical protein
MSETNTAACTTCSRLREEIERMFQEAQAHCKNCPGDPGIRCTEAAGYCHFRELEQQSTQAS